MVRSHSNSSANVLSCHTWVDDFLRGTGGANLVVLLRVQGHFRAVAKDLSEETR